MTAGQLAGIFIYFSSFLVMPLAEWSLHNIEVALCWEYQRFLNLALEHN